LSKRGNHEYTNTKEYTNNELQFVYL